MHSLPFLGKCWAHWLLRIHPTTEDSESATDLVWDIHPSFSWHQAHTSSTALMSHNTIETHSMVDRAHVPGLFLYTAPWRPGPLQAYVHVCVCVRMCACTRADVVMECVGECAWKTKHPERKQMAIGALPLLEPAPVIPPHQKTSFSALKQNNVWGLTLPKGEGAIICITASLISRITTYIL